ncbi:MAG: tetratricopeptide repeat protein [Bacteroidales bacterium]|nr:tetratricopeptide repeat protein [Bacteroidales bacterium]
MKKVLVILLLLTLLPFAEIHAQINHKHYVLMGKLELSKENYSDAIQNFNIAIIAKPNDFEAYFLRGIAKYSLGDFSGAVDDFTRTLEIHPLYVRAYHYRGVANDRLSNYADAMADYKKAISLDPFSEELHLASGSTLMHLNDYKNAVAEFDTALIINPENANAFISRGIAKRYLDDLDGSLEDMNSAVYNDFFNIEAVVRRGMIELEREDYQAAMYDFNNALHMDKDNPLIYFNRAVAFLNLGDTVAALRDYEKVNNLDQRNALTYFNRAIIYSIREEYDIALALYNKVIEINPQNIYGYFNRGILFYKMKQWDDAEDDFTKVIELFPDFIDAWVNRAVVKFEKNDIQGAEMDQYRAKQIMAFVSEDEANVDSLYSHYSKMDYNKIINFESDFIDGNKQKTLIQFSEIDIKPRGSFIVNLTDNAKSYIDATLSQISESNNFNSKMAFVANDLFDTNHKSLINDNLINSIENQQLKTFFEGMYNFEVFNYQKGENLFMSLLDDPVLGLYAGINLSALQNAKAELQVTDNNYDNSIYITQKRVGSNFTTTQEKPDYQQSLATITKVLSKNKKNPYVLYNLGNIHLQMQDFNKAIEYYTKAIQYEPNLAEAYYNRALTLLYLSNKNQAVKDLSKAGELGIQEAYVVMKRFSE